MNRCFAHFTPQAWVNDLAVEIDGAYSFDITAQVIRLGRETSLKITDDDYSADNLWHNNTASIDKPHHGPFVVRCVDEIRQFWEQFPEGQEPTEPPPEPHYFVELTDSGVQEFLTMAEAKRCILEDFAATGENRVQGVWAGNGDDPDAPDSIPLGVHWEITLATN